MNKIKIGNKNIGNFLKPFIIAEIGTNFKNIQEAKKMILISSQSGADAVKFQTYKAETLAIPDATFPDDSGKIISQYDYFKKTELSEKNHYILFKYAKKHKILFISTPSSKEDVDFLDSLGVPAFKTGSDDLTNLSLLKYIAEKKKPMIISTGMSTIQDIKKSIDIIRKTGNNKIIFLHCTVGYPAKFEDVNIRSIKVLQKKFNYPIGFSDHTFGFIAPILATSFGSCIIEKHVSIDKSRGGPDNDVAIDIRHLKHMIKAINKAYVSLGSFKKRVQVSEQKWVKAARKSLFTTCDIKKGTIITENMLIAKRPGNGIKTSDIYKIVGKIAKRDLKKNQLLKMPEVR